MDYDVFISYSRKDGNEYAERLQKELEAAGYKVWRDIRNINPAQDFTAEIEMGIKNSGAIALCLTPDTQRDNSFVRREIQYALVENRPVFPCRIHPITPHISVINNEWLEFHSDWKRAFDRLCAIIHDPNLQAASGTYQKPLENPFRDYLQALYRQIVDYLSRAVIRLIDLEAEETPAAVPRQRTDDMLLDFFDAAGLSAAETIEAGHRYDSFAQAFERHKGRLLLLGEPGAGKTITLMSYARDAVAARLDDPRKPLPVLKTVATWPSNPPLSITEWAAEKLDSLKPEINAGRALLLLDGLDELGSSRPIDPEKPEEGTYDPRKRFIDSVEQIPSRNQVLVTCRVKDYAAIDQQIPLEGAITLQPLSDELLREYLSDYPRIYDAIQDDDNLRNLARTPLLLSLIAFAWNELDTDLQMAGDLQAGDVRDAIFAAYIRQRYAHESRKKNAHLPFTLDKMLEVLGHAAMINASGGHRYKENSVFNISSIAENVLERHEFIHHLSDDEVDVFCALACDLHILYRRDNERHNFLHLLLRDHLAYAYSIAHLHDHSIYGKTYYPSPAKALSGLSDLRAFDPLIDALEDTNYKVRSAAAETLGKLGDVRAVEPLISALDDVDKQVCSSAIESLRILGDARAIEPLIGVLAHKDPWVRWAATNTLKHLGESMLMPLIDVLQHDNVHVRESAVQLLGVLGDSRAVDPLINTLADISPDVRKAAAETLEKLGDPRAVAPLINALADDNWEVRWSIIRTLEQLYKPTLESLLDILRHENTNVRVWAVNGLGKLEDTHAIELLIQALTDPDSEVRKSAARILGDLGEPALLPLFNALRHENTEVRKISAQILEKLGDVRAFEPLIDALADGDDGVRRSAASALGKLGDVRAFEPLIDALADGDDGVRRSAASALGKLGDVRAFEPLIDALADGDDGVRRSAASALGELGDVRAVPALIERLDDTAGQVPFRVCNEAASALKRIGTPEAMAAVREWKRREQWRWVQRMRKQ
ncbi:MAG: HEAT repeat domain-containing protein [Anaerolineaceae bacterium]|nr:HEAT repeat domain-containing protein [Anaerolineaceae bacterium]